MLETHLKEQQLFHEEEMSKSLEEYQETLKCASEKFEAEFNVGEELKYFFMIYLLFLSNLLIYGVFKLHCC